MNDTEVTKLFAELGISNQQAATLRTILLPEARVLLDEFLISNTDNTKEETDTTSEKEEVINEDLPSVEEGAPSCEDNDTASIATDNGYTADDTSTNLEIKGVTCDDDDASLATEDSATTDNGYTSENTSRHDNQTKEEEDMQESEHTATQTEEVEDNGGVTVDLYEYLIKISGEDAVILRPVLHPKARELLDELVSEGTIESTAMDDMTLVEEGALTVDLYDLLVKLSIKDATHLLPALHIKARELLDELLSNGTITKEAAAADQNNKTSKKGSSPTSIVDTPNDESVSGKTLLSENTSDSASSNLEEEFKEKCVNKQSSEISLNPELWATKAKEGRGIRTPNAMTKASSEVLQSRRIIKVSRHSQKYGGGRGSMPATAHTTLLPSGLPGISEKSSDPVARQLGTTSGGGSLEASWQQQQQKPSSSTTALPKGSAWVPDTQREERSSKHITNPRLGNTSNSTSSQGEVEEHVIKMDDSPFSNILAAVGTPLLSYLEPRELFCLSLANHYVNVVITESLFDVYHLQHQHRRQFKQLEPPITIEEIDSTIDNVHVDILDQHTFSTRKEIIEVLLDKIRVANLRYHRPGTLVATDTLEITMKQVEEDINDLSKWLVSDGAWYGTFRSDPNEIWKDSTRFSVGCRIGEHGQKGRSKRCWIDYLLRTVDQKRCNNELLLQRDWARMMIAQKG